MSWFQFLRPVYACMSFSPNLPLCVCVCVCVRFSNPHTGSFNFDHLIHVLSFTLKSGVTSYTTLKEILKRRSEHL